MTARTALAAYGLVVKLGARTVVDGVEMRLAPGSVNALVGRNGAGKTSLLRALAGLATPAQGRVMLGADVLLAMTPEGRALRLAWVPTPEPPPFPYSVLEVVQLGRFPRHRGRPRAEDRDAARRALVAVGLGGFDDRIVTELSGGELARVAVARGLAAETEVLLLDEPTASLDVAAALQLLTMLRQLAAEGRTIVLSLHDLALAHRYADHVVVLAAGRVVAAGAPAAALSPASLSQAFGVAAHVARTASGHETLICTALSSSTSTIS